MSRGIRPAKSLARLAQPVISPQGIVMSHLGVLASLILDLRAGAT